MTTELKPLTELAEKSDLVLYEGITTSDGHALGTTIIDSNLVGVNDFLTTVTLYISSGSAYREVRNISSFVAGTGTITVGTAFSTQILSGVSYKILATSSVADATLADISTIKGDTQVIEDSTLKAAPTAGSLSRYIASGGTALGTELPDSKSLYDCLSGGVTAVNRVAGKTQIIEISVTSAANAGDVTLATVTTQPCLIKAIVVHADTSQTSDMTTCAVYGGASKVLTLIGNTIATQANLDAIDKQVAWTGAVRLAATKTIVMNLAGGGVTAVDLTVTISYESCVNGGYLV